MSESQTATVRDERLEVKVYEREQMVWLELTDRATGICWGPDRLAVPEVYDRPLQRSEPLNKCRVDRVAETRYGIHVILGDTHRGVDVGLWLRLENGELSVVMPMSETYERHPRHFRLFAVDLLPNLASVGADGALVLPLAGGARVFPKGKPAVRDAFLIYLEQYRWELTPNMPYHAVHTPRGGLMCLARQGAADMQCRVATDGADGGRVSLAPTLRRHWPDPVDMEHRELRFVPLSGDINLEMALGTRLREHLMQDFGKPTLRQRAAASPEVEEMAWAFNIKAFHARENNGPEAMRFDKSDPVTFLNGMTFDECCEGLRWMHEAGIDRVHVKSVGWNARGHDGMYPQRFPVDERLGGEEGFREMVRYGRELGYQISVHDNFMMNGLDMPGFDPDLCVQDVYGDPLVSGWWGGADLEAQTWGLALPEERLHGHLRQMRDRLGIRGLYYCDYMARPLEVNYHPKWGGPRGDAARGQRRILEAAKEVFGAVGAEFPSLPILASVDYISMGKMGLRPMRSEWPIAALEPESTAIQSIAIAGLVLRERRGMDWSSVMDGVLFAGHPRDQWSFRNVGEPVMTRDRAATLKGIYDVQLARFGHLQFELIADYRNPAPGVQETTFSDGTTVKADFNQLHLEVNGETVERPASVPAQ